MSRTITTPIARISIISLLVIALLSLGLIAAVASKWGETYRIHHKWTVTVETPKGLVRGHSVMEFVYQNYPKHGVADESGSYYITGEVPVLDLGNGSFLSLMALYEPFLPVQAYKKKHLAALAGRDDYFRPVVKLMGADSEIVSLEREDYPLMLVHTDQYRADSFIETRAEDFERFVGPGYRLHSITLQQTSQPLTQGYIESVFNWVKVANQRYNYYYNAPTENVRFMKNLNRTDFISPRRCFIDYATIHNLSMGYLDTPMGCES